MNDNNSDLSRRIAQMRGWTVTPKANATWCLCLPDGTSSGHFLSEERAWAHIPQYADDLNLAWELFAETSQDEQFSTVGLESAGENNQARIVIFVGETWHEFEAETPARAICLAWLWWEERASE